MAKIYPVELQKSLKGVSFPASRDDVVKAAETNGADDDILQALRNLRETSFGTPADVSKALGEEM